MTTSKVLIIDDEARNIFALKATLMSRGIGCITTQDAVEGLELLENHTDIGLVLMDMMMPEMDGYEAISMIRKKEKFNHIPLVAVTAQAMIGDKEKCMEAGATDYLSKPIDVDKLMEIVTSYLK